MASARAMLERRRSSRLHIRIPVKLLSPRQADKKDNLNESGEAVAVSRTGALLRAPFSPELGSRIEVLHGVSEERREFRVVQVSSQRADGLFELGVEILNPARNFWGVQFPDESN